MPTLIVVPEGDVPNANQWICATLGEQSSPADLQTFGSPSHTRNGINFAVVSINDVFAVGARGVGTLAVPSWATGGEVNLGAATNFQSRMRVRNPSEAPGMSNPDWQNRPNVFDTPAPRTLLEAAGFTLYSGPEDPPE